MAPLYQAVTLVILVLIVRLDGLLRLVRNYMLMMLVWLVRLFRIIFCEYYQALCKFKGARAARGLAGQGGLGS